MVGNTFHGIKVTHGQAMRLGMDDLVGRAVSKYARNGLCGQPVRVAANLFNAMQNASAMYYEEVR